MKTNIKNKLFIIIAILLIIFSVSSSVFALSAEECGVFSDSVISYVRNLPEFNNYKYYLVEGNCSFSQQNPYIHVFLFNDETVEFYNGTANGWASIDSNKSFEFYHYVLVYNGAGGYIESIYYQGLENKQINNVCSGVINHTGYPIYANVPIYSDSSLTNFFFQTLSLRAIMRETGTQATGELTMIILIVIVTTGGLIALLIGLKKGLRTLVNGLRH